MIALNRGDFDRLFGELSAPDMRVENRSRSVFADRSAAELRASIEELNAMVASARTWHSAMRWLSPTWCVARNEREAVGQDGEQYTWTRIHVSEIHDGRLASMCEFDLEDEEAAFAYAEERVRAAASRLAVTNRASRDWHRDFMRGNAGPRPRRLTVACYSDRFVYDDRRRLSGDPLRTDHANRRMNASLTQYSHFEWTHPGRAGRAPASGLEPLVGRRRKRDVLSASYIEVGDDGRIDLRGPLRRGRLRRRLPRTRAPLLRRRGRGVRRSGCYPD